MPKLLKGRVTSLESAGDIGSFHAGTRRRGSQAGLGCMVLTLATYGYRPNLFIYASSLATALVTLLLLNSRRYREMRTCLAEYREKRRKERLARR
ncbi:hypothetical protein N5C37_24035 [Pseudomonas mosselii]|uniref:hypothetical protein n=1 Tax=Pseudomonas mosselii TaxID=78327 RepID=UPI00244D5B21|nr:hypothetical protein [Pseudomonas mosselii]MDH1104178.1 hypothetical protein [Pseudomonas mosselii]